METGIIFNLSVVSILLLLNCVSTDVNANETCGTASKHDSCESCLSQEDLHCIFISYLEGSELPSECADISLTISKITEKATIYTKKDECDVSDNLSNDSNANVVSNETANDTLSNEEDSTSVASTTESPPDNDHNEKTKITSTATTSSNAPSTKTERPVTTDPPADPPTSTVSTRSSSTIPNQEKNTTTITHHVLLVQPVQHGGSFHGWSFFGGIILVVCVSFLAFFGFKYYKSVRDGRPFSHRLFGNNPYHGRQDSDEPSFPF